MKRRHVNLGQRIVLIVAFGAVLFMVGTWITSWGSDVGWVGVAPLSNTFNFSGNNPFHPWVPLVVWLILIATWSLVSCVLLRNVTREENETGDANASQQS